MILRKPIAGEPPPAPPPLPQGVELVAAERLEESEARLAQVQEKLRRRRENHEQLIEEHAQLLERIRALEDERR